MLRCRGRSTVHAPVYSRLKKARESTGTKGERDIAYAEIQRIQGAGKSGTSEYTGSLSELSGLVPAAQVQWDNKKVLDVDREVERSYARPEDVVSADKRRRLGDALQEADSPNLTRSELVASYLRTHNYRIAG